MQVLDARPPETEMKEPGAPPGEDSYSTVGGSTPELERPKGGRGLRERDKV